MAWLAKVALALVSLALSVSLVEIAVRALGLAPEVRPILVSGDSSVYQRSSNPVLAFELKPGYRNDDADFVVSYTRTNALGQRDVERSVEKAPGTTRVILLGDSVVEGSGVVDLDDTISRQLERLAADDGLEVLNFGVSGYCTLAEVELLATKGIALGPDVVIVVFVWNDFENYNRQLFLQLDAPARPAWATGAFRRSAIFRLAALRLDLWGFGAESDPMGWNRSAVGDNNVVEGLARLAELSDRHGFLPIVAVWPRFTNERIENVHFLPGAERELVIERLASMHGIASVRMSRHFRRDWRAHGQEVPPRIRYTQGDGMHPSPEGTRVAATGLRDVLADLGSGPRPEPQQRPDDDLALEAARALGRGEPFYAPAYNNTGLKLEREGDLDAAIEHYRRALEIDPDHTRALTNLGQALVKRGRPDEGIVYLRRATRSDPNYAQARYDLAILLAQRGDRAEAARLLREALRIDPSMEAAREALGKIEGS